MRAAGTIALVLMSLAMAGTVALELRPIRRTAAPAVAMSRPETGPVDALGNSAELVGNWVQTILTRPLFSPSRRPPNIQVAATSAPPPSLPRLSGIVIDGKQRRVIFAADDGGKTVTVAEGGTFDGYKVELIDARGVTVAGSGGRQVLRPRYDTKTPSASQVVQGQAVMPPFQGLVPPGGLAPQPGPYNGPPGLDMMPRPVALAPGAPNVLPSLPGLPGLPGVNGGSGLPGFPLPPPR